MKQKQARHPPTDEAETAPAERPRLSRASALKLAKQKLWAAMPKLLDSAILRAEEGNPTHLRLLFELAGMDKGALLPASAQPREKSLETILLEQWARDKQDFAELDAERAEQDRLNAL